MSQTKTDPRALARRALRPILRRRAYGGIDALREAGTARAEGLADALDRVLRPERRSPDDADWWIARIESRRAAMNASEAPVEQRDFGAGKGGDEGRSAAEMSRGVVVRTTVGEVSRSLSKPPLWSRLLFELVRETAPKTALEFGTAVGVSSAYQGAALALNGFGRLTTLEGNPAFARIARENLDALGIETVDIVVGRFDESLERVLPTLRSLSYVFVDGHHDERATLDYFERLLGHLDAHALVVFDDIAWSAGMRRAWRAIARHRKCALSVDLDTVGLCIVGDGPGRALHVPMRGIG